MIRALGAASQPTPVVTQTTISSQPAPTVINPSSPPLTQREDIAATARATIRMRLQTWWSSPPAGCAACHTGAQAQKGFTLDSLLALDRKGLIDKVWKAHIDTTDEKVRMPLAKGADGKFVPGRPLTMQERQPLYDYISTLQP